MREMQKREERGWCEGGGGVSVPSSLANGQKKGVERESFLEREREGGTEIGEFYQGRREKIDPTRGLGEFIGISLHFAPRVVCSIVYF